MKPKRVTDCGADRIFRPSRSVLKLTPETRPLWGTHGRCRERLGGLLRYYHRAASARDAFLMP